MKALECLGVPFLCISIVLLASCGQQAGKKEETPTAPPETKSGIEASSKEAAYMEEGRSLYAQHCLVCHQQGGGGVNGLNPPLKNTEYVTGDKNRLLGILINGSNEGLVVAGKTYANAMPGFAHLSDGELAAIASFLRNSFGNKASEVTAEEVALARSL